MLISATIVPYSEKREEGIAELAQHMVYLCIQFVRPIKRTPSLEDRMSNLKDTVVRDRRVRREAGNEVLLTNQSPRVAKVVREGDITSTRVSHRSQKSLSAMTPIASPSCDWMLGGTEIMSPISSCLMAATSSCGNL